MKTKLIRFFMLIDKKIDIRKFIKFGLVGVLNTGINLGVFTFCNEVMLFPVTMCEFFGTVVAMANSFAFNKFWTFKKQGFDIKEILKFVILNVISLAVSISAIHLLHNIMGINEYLAKLPIYVLTTCINYVGNKLFVFKQENK